MLSVPLCALFCAPQQLSHEGDVLAGTADKNLPYNTHYGETVDTYFTLWSPQTTTLLEGKQSKIAGYVDAAVDAGFRTLVTAFNWESLEEHKRGERSIIASYSHVLDRAALRGLDVVIVVNLAIAPRWLFDEVPDSRTLGVLDYKPTKKNARKWGLLHKMLGLFGDAGRRASIPGYASISGRQYPEPSIMNPMVLTLAEELLEWLVHAVARHPAGWTVRAYQPCFNLELETKHRLTEGVFVDYNPLMQMHYREWLQGMNGDAAYWLRRWGRSASGGWETVTAPVITLEYSDEKRRQTRFYDFQEFREAKLCATYESMCHVVARSGGRCSLHFGNVFTTIDNMMTSAQFNLMKSPFVHEFAIDSNFNSYHHAESSIEVGGMLASMALPYHKPFYFEAAVELFAHKPDDLSRIVRRGFTSALAAGAVGIGVTNVDDPALFGTLLTGAHRTARRFVQSPQAVLFTPYMSYYAVHHKIMCDNQHDWECNQDALQYPLLKSWSKLQQQVTEGGTWLLGDVALLQRSLLRKVDNRLFIYRPPGTVVPTFVAARLRYLCAHGVLCEFIDGDVSTLPELDVYRHVSASMPRAAFVSPTVTCHHLTHARCADKEIYPGSVQEQLRREYTPTVAFLAKESLAEGTANGFNTHKKQRMHSGTTNDDTRTRSIADSSVNLSCSRGCLRRPSPESRILLSFDVSFSGLTNQHVALLHGVTVACALGADGIISPKLRIGLHHEDIDPSVLKDGNPYKHIVDRAAHTMAEVGIGYYYNNRSFAAGISEIGLSEEEVISGPSVKWITFNNTLRPSIRGDAMSNICRRIQSTLDASMRAWRHAPPHVIVIDVGESVGLLSIDQSTAKVLAHMDRALRYNDVIIEQAAFAIKKMTSSGTVYNGLHFRISPEAQATWHVITPAAMKETPRKLLKAGFDPNVPLFVASGVPKASFAHLLAPFNVVTIDDILVEHSKVAHLESLGPVNQLVLENANLFAGFSLSSYSCAIARHRKQARTCRPSVTYDQPGSHFSTHYFWTGDRPMCACDAGSLDGIVIRKQAADVPRARFIFFAGLESSGHSFWRDILAEFPNRIKQVKEPSHLLYTVKH